MIYADHSATTPVDARVREVVCQMMEACYGNPSSPHQTGIEARQALTEGRNQVARLIGAAEGTWETPGEVVFTASGTESNNLAIHGAVQARQQKGRHIITSRIEHHAVLRVFEGLESRGMEVTYLPVDGGGRVSPADLKDALRPDTVLVSIMMANNEVGTIQPIRELAALCKRQGTLFHTDAVQAAGKIPLHVDRLGVDMMSLSAHKLYGPKGVGALYVREGLSLQPLMQGGGQEQGLRPGTHNVPGIAGFGQACLIAADKLEAETDRLKGLTAALKEGLIERCPDLVFHGSPDQMLPGFLSFSPLYVQGDSLLTALDLAGIQVSAGSACTTGVKEPSHVLTAMGVNPQLCQSAVRVTLGRDNTENDVEQMLHLFPEIIGRLRDMSPLYQDVLERQQRLEDH